MAEVFRYLVTPSGAKIAQRRSDLAQLTGVGRTCSPLRSRSSRAATRASCARSTTRPAYEIFHDVLAQPAAGLAGSLPRGEVAAPRGALGHGAAAAAAIVIALIAHVLEPAWLNEAELMPFDARFALRGDVHVDLRHRDRRSR